MTDTSHKDTFKVYNVKESLQAGKVYDLPLFPSKGKTVCEQVPSRKAEAGAHRRRKEMGGRTGRLKAPLEALFLFLTAPLPPQPSCLCPIQEAALFLFPLKLLHQPTQGPEPQSKILGLYSTTLGALKELKERIKLGVWGESRV